MSDHVTALSGAESDGGIATVREVGVQGMITLRGDLSNAKLKKAVKSACGHAVPEPRAAAMDGEAGVAWMSPDELLILCPHADVQQTLDTLDKALKGSHHLAVDVSAARASFRVEGARAREVIGKLCPVDLSLDSFGMGDFRRTRMAQVPAAFWLTGDDALQVICFRSQAQYVFDLLCIAAQPGSEVML